MLSFAYDKLCPFSNSASLRSSDQEPVVVPRTCLKLKDHLLLPSLPQTSGTDPLHIRNTPSTECFNHIFRPDDGFTVVFSIMMPFVLL